MNSIRYIRALLLLVSMVGAVASLPGQGVIPSKGKEFWLGFMRNWGAPGGSLEVIVSGDVATTGVVSIPGAGMEWPFTVVPGVTTTVNVPLSAALHMASEVVENKGVLVLTQDTVSVFAINFEPTTADGTVVYPVEALGIDYRIVSYTGINTGPNAGGEFLIVATRDGTEVEITTTAMTLLGQPAGVPWVVQLDSGQTYQVRAMGPTVDLTGSTVRGTAASGSCRPFAVFSGSVCSEVPTGCWSCDHLYEQQTPVNTWGTVYQAPPFAANTSFAYRVLAHEDGTHVSIDGGPPVLLNAGQWYDEQNATAGVCFTSDRPVAVTQFMKGFFCSGAGDPSMVQLSSQDQVIDHITFSTVVSPVITEHYVTVVLATADIGDITLDGVPVPPGQFAPFPACPQRSYAHLPLAEGSHTLACANGFSAYVYGSGQEESYAYSVGAFTPPPPLPIHEVICGTDVNGMVSLTIPYPIQDPAWTLLDVPEDTLHLGDTYVFAPTTSALYEVTGTEYVSECPVRFIYSVELEDPPLLTVTASETGVCAFTPVQLNVAIDPPGQYVIAWSPTNTVSDPTSAAPIALPMTDTWYRVEVTTYTGCATATDSVFVAAAMGNLLELEVAPLDTTICLGGAVQLTATGREVVLYDTFEGGSWGAGWLQVQGAGTSTACGSVSGDALYFNGGIQRQATTVDMNLAQGGVIRFALVIGTGVAPCENADPGDDVVLEYSTNGGANWTLIATYPEWAYPAFTLIEEPLPAPGASTSTRLRWRQLGTWTAGQDNWALDDVLVARDGAVPTSIVWSPAAGLSDATSATPLATPTATTSYTITATDASGLCTHTAVAHIEVLPPFPIAITGDTIVCSAIGLPLEVTHGMQGATVQWEPAADLDDPTSETPHVQLDSTQVYVVTVVDPVGCAAIDSVTVTVPFTDLPLPLDTAICLGQSVLLDPGQPGVGHQWNTGAGTPTITVDTSGTYTVQMTGPNGCEAEWTAVVQVHDPPLVVLGGDTTLCAGETLLLEAGPGAAHVWSDGSVNDALTVTTAGTYWVQVVNAAGCSGSDTIVVAFQSAPVVPLSDATACEGGQLVLDAGNDGVSYQWTNGASTPTVTVNDEVDQIGVTVTNAAGCSTHVDIQLQWLAYPRPDLGPDTLLCEGGSVILGAGAPATDYLWSTGATSPTLVVSQAGTYWVQAANGPCADRDTVLVDVVPPPPAVLPEKAYFCVDDPPFHVLLVAGEPQQAYAWTVPYGQSAGQGPVMQATGPGLYTVVITNEWGCVTTDAVEVVSTCPPILYIPNAFTPDGDGVNEVFRPVGLNIVELELLIFNRWGELIHEAAGLQAHWDGMYKGEACPDGVYTWVVRYKAAEQGSVPTTWAERRGHVTLLR